VYVSSTSKVFIKHFELFADHIIRKFNLNDSTLVVDIGSNDGILLKPLKDRGKRVLGVEPARHIAKMASKNGIPTIADWFTQDAAKRIVRKHGHASIVTGTNVFAHIDDLDEVLRGVKTLLGPNGVFITESPYLIDFIQKSYFDLVYHEHLSYWSIRSLDRLFHRFDMEVFAVEKVPVHGGSIRVYAQKINDGHKMQKSVKKFLAKEKKMKLSDKNTYIEYEMKILENKRKLIDLLTKLKRRGNTIVGYGAPAKGNTLLNYFKIGLEIVDYIVDDSPLKQGLYTPGTHIPVVSSKKLNEMTPDYVLILAWNFSSSIMENLSWLKKKGAKFIIPVPSPKVR
jgi:SAM-dependent methyltransferase